MIIKMDTWRERLFYLRFLILGVVFLFETVFDELVERNNLLVPIYFLIVGLSVTTSVSSVSLAFDTEREKENTARLTT